MLEAIFWIGVGLLVHTYFLYPLSLPILHFFFALPRRFGHSHKYKVSLVIAAHNEEKVIEEKIRNCFELEFPRRNLEILIGSDASSDRTNEIIRKYRDDVRLIELEERGGKASVLNRIVPEATGEILVFCDANTMLLKNALQKLLAPFNDPGVGCVCGRLILHDSGKSALGIGESIYWNFESEIKKLEGRLGIVIGANGGIYAIRKELFQQIPVDKVAMDDFFVTTRVLLAGKSAIYEPQAIGSEETSLEKYGEFHRKVRISQANFNLLPRYLPLLNPWHGLVAYGFFSHKLLRWMAPLILIALLFTNFVLATHGALYASLLALQVSFYAAAGIGYWRNARGHRSKLFLIPFYFVSMNVALLAGMLKAIMVRKGAEKTGMWERIERASAPSFDSAPAPINGTPNGQGDSSHTNGFGAKANGVHSANGTLSRSKGATSPRVVNEYIP